MPSSTPSGLQSARFPLRLEIESLLSRKPRFCCLPPVRGQIRRRGPTGGAIDVLCSVQAQPQPAAPFAIFEFQVDEFGIVLNVHNCLHCNEFLFCANKKALCRFLGHRARFSYDDLFKLFSS